MDPTASRVPGVLLWDRGFGPSARTEPLSRQPAALMLVQWLRALHSRLQVRENRRLVTDLMSTGGMFSTPVLWVPPLMQSIHRSSAFTWSALMNWFQTAGHEWMMLILQRIRNNASKLVGISETVPRGARYTNPILVRRGGLEVR